MLMKRIYEEQDLERYRQEREGTSQKWRARFTAIGVPQGLVDSFAKQVSETVTQPPLVEGVELLHTGAHAEQNFSTPLITEFVKLGIAEIHDDELILRTAQEDLHYTIKRKPGRYCLYCGEKLPDDENGELARLHIAMKHNGKPSPVETEPSGYVWLKYFECVLDEDQHNQFKAEVRNG